MNSTSKLFITTDQRNAELLLAGVAIPVPVLSSVEMIMSGFNMHSFLCFNDVSQFDALFTTKEREIASSLLLCINESWKKYFHRGDGSLCDAQLVVVQLKADCHRQKSGTVSSFYFAFSSTVRIVPNILNNSCVNI
jgi:hypothetical protein